MERSIDFHVYAFVVPLVCGTLGITIKLWALTNVSLVVEVPEGGGGKLHLQPLLDIIDYLDWLFVSASVIALAVLYLEEKKMGLNIRKLISQVRTILAIYKKYVAIFLIDIILKRLELSNYLVLRALE